MYCTAHAHDVLHCICSSFVFVLYWYDNSFSVWTNINVPISLYQSISSISTIYAGAKKGKEEEKEDGGKENKKKR